MNFERMKMLAAHMRSLSPKRYRQDLFFHACNTPACLAGHALGLREGLRPGEPFDRVCIDAGFEAAAWLGLTEPQAGYLFAAYPAWGRAGKREPTPAEAADEIERMIAEEESKA